MPRLDDQLLVKTEKLKIQGRIIGIDEYQLENFMSGHHSWLSYTLVSDKSRLFKRFWVTNWKKAGWYLWTASKEIKNPKIKKVIQDRSGIARITFKGDQGFSTPFAALTVYETEKGKYYSTERFAGSKAMYFRAEKIQKPKIIK